MRKSVLIVGAVLSMAVIAWWITPGFGGQRTRAEREHGIKLPSSAMDIQCKGDAWLRFLDRGATTMFEMSTKDLPSFLAQIRIQSRTAPAHATGDPMVNGWNVWPINAPTFIPGNQQYGGFRRTWKGDAVPIEMLSCSSPVGDWLHVELWRLEGESLLVKMHTDWN